MAKQKAIKVDKEKFGWIKDLYDNEYKYIFMPKKNRSEFYATKASLKKNGDFRDTAKFDVFKMDKNESWISGADAKGVLIHIDKKVTY